MGSMSLSCAWSGGRRLRRSSGRRSILYIPSNSFLACSNFSSCLRLAFSSSSPSAISVFSFSACSRTTSTGVFFFHGLRVSALAGAGAGFGSFFGAGILLLLFEFFLLLVYPCLKHPDSFTLCRKLNVGVDRVDFRARRMAHQRHADFLQDTGLHKAGVEGMPKVMEAQVAYTGV